MTMETVATLCSIVGAGSPINFFVQRHFSRRDEATRQEIKRQQAEQAERDRKRIPCDAGRTGHDAVSGLAEIKD